MSDAQQGNNAQMDPPPAPQPMSQTTAQAAPTVPTPPPAGAPAQPPFPAPPAVEDNSFWIKVVIFFNPLASIVFFLLNRDDSPAKAKRALGTGWFATIFWTIAVGAIFALYFVGGIIAMIVSLAAVGSMGHSGW